MPITPLFIQGLDYRAYCKRSFEVFAKTLVDEFAKSRRYGKRKTLAYSG